MHQDTDHVCQIKRYLYSTIGDVKCNPSGQTEWWTSDAHYHSKSVVENIKHRWLSFIASAFLQFVHYEHCHIPNNFAPFAMLVLSYFVVWYQWILRISLLMTTLTELLVNNLQKHTNIQYSWNKIKNTQSAEFHGINWTSVLRHHIVIYRQ